MLRPEPDVTSLEQAQALASQLDQKLRGFTAAFGNQCDKVAIQVSTPQGMSKLLDPLSTDQVADIVGRLKKDAPIQQAEFVFLMEACAPRYYHPGPSVLLAWDPDVAAVLTRRYPDRRAVIASAFWPSAEEIAAVIGHEKYGHGFLYLETKLGRQLVHILSDAEALSGHRFAERAGLRQCALEEGFLRGERYLASLSSGQCRGRGRGFLGLDSNQAFLCLEGQFASYAAYKLTRHPFSVPFKGLIPFLPYFQARGLPAAGRTTLQPP